MAGVAGPISIRGHNEGVNSRGAISNYACSVVAIMSSIANVRHTHQRKKALLVLYTALQFGKEDECYRGHG